MAIVIYNPLCLLIFLCSLCLINTETVNDVNCFMSDYSLPNTLSIGFIGDKMYQYTLKHKLIMYKIQVRFDTIYPTFYLYGGEGRNFLELHPEYKNDERYTYIFGSSENVLLDRTSFAVQVNPNDNEYILCFYLLITERTAQYALCQKHNQYDNFKPYINTYYNMPLNKVLPINTAFKNTKFHVRNFGIIKNQNTGIFTDPNLIESFFDGFICFDKTTAESSFKMIRKRSDKNCNPITPIINDARFVFIYDKIIYFVLIQNEVVYAVTEELIKNMDIWYPYKKFKLENLFRCDKQDGETPETTSLPTVETTQTESKPITETMAPNTAVPIIPTTQTILPTTKPRTNAINSNKIFGWDINYVVILTLAIVMIIFTSVLYFLFSSKRSRRYKRKRYGHSSSYADSSPRWFRRRKRRR